MFETATIPTTTTTTTEAALTTWQFLPQQNSELNVLF
jgi:hypothetical protein